MGRLGLPGPDDGPILQNDGTELEGSTAVRACDGLPRLELDYGLLDIESMGQLDQAADGIQAHLAVGIHEAEVSDFHEPGWQNVLEKTPDEFHDIESHGSPALAARLFVTKGDDPILDFDNAAIGDRHLEHVGREIFEAGRAFANSLAVDVPLGPPNIGRDLVEEPRGLHPVPELGPEDFRQGPYRQIEVDS